MASLASGTKTEGLTEGVRDAISIMTHPFLKATASVKGGASHVAGLVLDYRAAREEAEDLRHALGQMSVRLARQRELAAQAKRLRHLLDFQEREPLVLTQTARILGRSKGTLVVDKGSRDGVEPFMSVVCPEGVVGQVTEVRPFHAFVQTLHHADTKVSAMIRRNRVRGAVHGSGSDVSRICTMHYMDLREDVREGDVVVASEGSVHPTGCEIGTISAVHDEGLTVKSADITLAANPYDLDEALLVVKSFARVRELAGGKGGERIESPLTHLPKAPTLQERYAP